jgi:hypothetical protein
MRRTVVCRDRHASRSDHDRRLFIAFAAGPVFAIASICIAQAATKEEVNRCRAIEQRADRVACFNALKQNKPAKTEGPDPANAESTSSTKRPDGASIKAGSTATSDVPPSPPGTPTVLRSMICSAVRSVWIATASPPCSWLASNFRPSASFFARLPNDSGRRQSRNFGTVSRSVPIHAFDKGQGDVP